MARCSWCMVDYQLQERGRGKSLEELSAHWDRLPMEAKKSVQVLETEMGKAQYNVV